ncbi:MAG TPA: MMPL family transporter [Thermoguttaceae bacterium]|nr:MMPL family transporter [Thermoguttaceae bacterium]
MFDRLGAFVSRYHLLVLLGWTVLVAVIAWKAPNWDDITYDGDFAYLPAWVTSVQGEKLLQEAFPDIKAKSQIILVVARHNGPLQPADMAVVDRLFHEFAPAGEQGVVEGDDEDLIASAWSYQSQVVGRKLISQPSKDQPGQATLVALMLRNEFMAIENMARVKEINDRLIEIQNEEDFPEGLELGITGSAAVGVDYLYAAAESIQNTELTTIVLVVFILLLVYRAPGLVIVPLVTIAASVGVAKGLVAMLVDYSNGVDWLDFKVFSTTEIFIIVILFGAGTDYCLFLISRYREELRRGHEPKPAIATALGQVGNALAASALTTIFGLGMMFFADFGKFSNSGPAIALCLAVALAACLTLAPALLRAGGRIVFWPFGTAAANGTTEGDDSSLFGGFWERLSRVVITRPGLILLAAVLLLAPLVYAGLEVPLTYDLLGELKSDRASVRGTKLLCQYFDPGQTGPVTILARLDQGQFDTQEGENKISRLTGFLYYLQYKTDDGGKTTTIDPILSVRSRTEPLGDRPGSYGKLAVLHQPETELIFLAHAPQYHGKVTRLDLILPYDPFSHKSIELLGFIENRLQGLADGSCSQWSDDQWPEQLAPDYRQQLCADWKGADFHFTGTTAVIRDLAAVTAADQIRIQILVVIAVLAVLILILRRPGICVYLIFSVLLGFFVTIGITELFFSWLYGDTFHGLDWKVPLFLFVILIAVGEDYNIYLATRVFEEQRRRGPTEGLRVAVVLTGGIITSCGVIMAGTFASMATGTLRAMIELGFALALGVLLDTFIIRTILVPAFLAILARRQESRHLAPRDEASSRGARRLL